MSRPLPRPFGRYELVALLGEGGMARVYLARAQGPSGFSRMMAIKVMHEGVGQEPALRQALVTEARIAGLLHHPGIVAVHDFGDVDGQPYVAMEWVDGLDLSRLLGHAGGLPPRLALDVGIAIAEALHYVHTLDGPDGPLRLVHRDLKPSNVLVGRRGEVKLMDFGLARADGLVKSTTATGVAKGSAPWMSPEQALANPLDARSDVFALGTVLYELAVGQRFNDQPSVTAVVGGLLAVEERIGPGGELDVLDTAVPGLAAVVRRCLRRDREERFDDAEAVAVELRRLRAGIREAPTLASRVEAALGTKSSPGLLDPTDAVPADQLPSAAPVTTFAEAVRSPETRRAFVVGLFSVLGALAAGAVILAVRAFGPMAPPVTAEVASVAAPTVRAEQVSPGAQPEGEPAVSPDGARVVFVRVVEGQWTLVLRELATGAEEPVQAGELRDLSQPAWSPDGTRLALHARLPVPGLYVVDLGGKSPPLRVTQGGAHPAWSPDGRRLAHTTDHVSRPTAKRHTSPLVVVDLDTLEATELHPGDANQPAWSPDGARIAYWTVRPDGRRDVLTIDAGGGEPVAVTDDAALDWSPVWGPAGRHLYFLSNRGGANGLHRVPLDASTFAAAAPPTLLAGASASPGFLSIDRAGRTLLYDTESREENIQLLKVGGEAQWLTAGARVAVWSEPAPGGERVVWVEDRGAEDLWLGTVGETPRRLTNDAWRERMPHWLDADRFAFYSDRDGAWGLWIWDLRTDVVEPVEAGGGLATFAVGNGRIAATQQSSNALFLLDGTPRQRKRALLDHPADLKPLPSSWSPDGRLILEGARALSRERWVAAWDPASGVLELLEPPTASMLRWLDDDRLVAARGGAVVQFEWPDGSDEVLHRTPPGTNIGWLGLSLDRRFLTVHADRESTGIWLWELGDAGL